MHLRSLVAKSARWLLARAGYELIPHGAFGHNAFRDIQLLSDRWGFPIRTFFDVGAHEGQTTLTAAKLFPNACIFSFEPHPSTFERLVHATKDASKVKLVQCALGASTEDQIMHTYGSSLINSLLPNAPYAVRFGRQQSSQIVVNCSTVDRFCSEQNIEKIDVLKIDTEGFDLEVLKGASSMLDRGAVSFIYFEFNDIHPSKAASGGALAPIDEHLRRYRYHFIASYNDYITTEGELFAVSNALYAMHYQSERAASDVSRW